MQPALFALCALCFAAGIACGWYLSVTIRNIPEPGQSTPDQSESPMLRIGPSRISGRGVLATRPIEKGETLERCPVLEVNEGDIGGELLNYVFYGNDPSKRLVAMGSGMLFNHSSTPNVGYWLEESKLGPELVLYTLRRVEKGEELFYDYGKEWWESRQLPQKS